MSVLVVGSIALDTIETPFGMANDTIGGSGTFFSAAASLFAEVQLVGVVGDDFPLEQLRFLEKRGVDLTGVEQAPGESFRWSGVYSYDLNSRETRETRLGVFADFQPKLPERFCDAEWLFLGNIDPELQLDVLRQVKQPRLVACDTMNFWISGKRDALLELLGRVNLLMVNDSEARELSGDHNLLRAARWIQQQGPEMVIVKKGEHGAVLFTKDLIFYAPGFPLEDVFDPTGAGDTFAGGLLGYVARHGSFDLGTFRRATVHGCVMASFVVEDFSFDAMRRLDEAAISKRLNAFHDLVTFERLSELA